MSETAPEVPAQPTTPAPEASANPAATLPPPETPDINSLPEWARDALSKANKEAAGYRTKLREVEPLVKKAAELEESQKTEQQKTADRAIAAERQRDDAIADGLRYKAAAKHGIGEDYFDLLGSGDEEAIDGRALRIGTLLGLRTENEQLKADLEALRAGRPVPSRPTEALRPGATPAPSSDLADNSYPASWLPASAQRTN